MEATCDDVKARIAVMQLVHEARALDSHQRLVQRIASTNDPESAKLVDILCGEEVRHVQLGVKWFVRLCEEDKVVPRDTFARIVKRYIKSPLPGPFNDAARQKAGMNQDWYLPLARK